MPATRQFVQANVLDAYRADLARAGRSTLGRADHSCLVFATLLHHAILLPRGDRQAYLWNAFLSGDGPPDGLRPGETRDILAPLGEKACHLAEYAEARGGFAVATTILDLARCLFADGDAHLIGRLVYLQARILAKIGQLEVAMDLLADVDQVGYRAPTCDLQSLASTGSE